MITLHTTDGHSGKRTEGVPEGLEATPHQSTFQGEEYTYHTYRWPELGPARLYDAAKDIVVPIAGRRYRMTITIDGTDDDYHSIPESAVVTFEPTDEPETPFEPFDAAAVQQKHRKHLVAQIAEYEAEDAKDGDNFWKDWIEQHKKTIKRIDDGEEVYGHGKFLQVFGQPVFIQNPIFPEYEGRSAYHLATLETGWGDSGNINIMIALDADGVPVQAWFEASCC